jgi:hypothetical protein
VLLERGFHFVQVNGLWKSGCGGVCGAHSVIKLANAPMEVNGQAS